MGVEVVSQLLLNSQLRLSSFVPAAAMPQAGPGESREQGAKIHGSPEHFSALQFVVTVCRYFAGGFSRARTLVSSVTRCIPNP